MTGQDETIFYDGFRVTLRSNSSFELYVNIAQGTSLAAVSIELYGFTGGCNKLKRHREIKDKVN